MRKRVVVIGGGISGLSRAWALKQRYGDSIDLKIFEGSDRAGGWIRSREVDGFLFEQGPRSCRTHGAGIETLKLLEALGLEGEVNLASPEARNRYIYFGGKLQKLPRTFFEFLRSPIMCGVIPAMLKEWCVPSNTDSDPSIRDFIGKRLSYPIADRLFDPLVTGIYAGDISKLSMRSCFPAIFNLVEEHGSIVLGMLCKIFTKRSEKHSPFVERTLKSPIFTLKSGMEKLVETLASRLSSEIRLNSPITAIRVDGNKVIFQTHLGDEITADEVHLAVGAGVAAKILKGSNDDLSKKMETITATSVITVNLGWRNPVLIQEGFGYLIPSGEREDLLGVVWDSSAFPGQNKHLGETRLTAMVGGAHRQDLMGLSDAEVLSIVESALKKHLGIIQKPDSTYIGRAKNAIPQYACGHRALVDSIEQELREWSGSKIHLLGSSWHGVSVNDCIAEGL